MLRVCVLGGFLLASVSAEGALRLVESVGVDDFDVPETGTVVGTAFSHGGPIAGVGLSGLWVPVVADGGGGTAPWSVDLSVSVQAPGGETLSWPMVGGEVSIAAYPLSDAAGEFSTGPGAGMYEWTFGSISGPWVAGLRDVELHLLDEVPDVVDVINGTLIGQPMWDRPFSIVGVSGLGPVTYEAVEFTVPVGGHYTLESVHPDLNDHWASLYEGVFDPAQPLLNQLDYGLGNGFGANGSPRGVALIESLLFEGRTYTIVTSQWASFRPETTYTLTVTGPASISLAGACPADLDSDGVVGASDLALLLAAWGQMGSAADLDGSGVVGSGDLAVLLAAWGPC